MARSVRSPAKVVLIVAGVVIVAAVVVRLRQQQMLAAEATDAIRSQLDDLDPVTKAAVRARLAKDAVSEAKHH